MNKAQQLMCECYEAKFNMDILTQIKQMKDDFLARLVGISKGDTDAFKKGIQKFLAERTQFQSLKKALMAYLPTWKAEQEKATA
jgi:hypothetical protein